MKPDDIDALVEQLVTLLSTAPAEVRTKFRFVVEEFTAPQSKASKKDAERRLKQVIAELKGQLE